MGIGAGSISFHLMVRIVLRRRRTVVAYLFGLGLGQAGRKSLGRQVKPGRLRGVWHVTTLISSHTPNKAWHGM